MRISPQPLLLAVAAAVLVVLAPASARAALEGENVGKALRAERAAAAPAIDGRLDDAAWIAAAAAADDRFTQTFPGDGVVPSVKTAVQIVYDDEAVYVGVRAYDDEPDRITRRLSRRDEEVEADIIYIGFDSRLDHRSAFGFGLTAAGVQTDFLMYNDTQISTDWDAVWDGAVARDAQGWSAEFRIPLSVLRFAERDEQVWGFDLLRYIPRRKEEIHWAPTPRGVNANVSRWGHIEGIRGVRPRRTLELRPYWASSIEHGTSSGLSFLGLDPHARRAATWNLGVDVKLGVTRGLTLDATINPDFGQVEADPAVLNLTRFESFFPEKRPFFSEGADVFELPIQVYYSRRIGRPPSGLGDGAGVLDERGMPVEIVRAPRALPIWGAAKLAGSVGDRLTIATLAAVTGPERFLVLDEGGGAGELERAPARHYAALRARWALGGTSSVGLLATGVTRLGGSLASARADHDAYVQSADVRWSPTARWTLSGQGVLSERVGGPARQDGDGRACTAPFGDPVCTPITRADGTPQEPGDLGAGARLGLDYASPDWFWASFVRTLSPRLDVNDLGFVQENNQHVADSFVARRWQGKGAILRGQVGGGAQVVYDYEGERLYAGGGVNSEILWKNYWFNFARLGLMAPGGKHAYEFGDGAYLERLPWLMFNSWSETNSSKDVSGGLGVNGGHALGNTGWFVFLESNLNVHVIAPLDLSLGATLSWEANDLRAWFNEPCVDDAGFACTTETETRHYKLAQLDSGALSFSLRGSYTFSPRLTLQAYAQLFTAAGSFHDRRVVSTSGTRRPILTRDQLMIDPGFTGDLDGDGRPDDGFQDTSLSLNVVMRWELAPGSTLIAVYTRGQWADYDLGGAAPRFRLTGLSTGPTEEVLLMKLVYFYS